MSDLLDHIHLEYISMPDIISRPVHIHFTVTLLVSLRQHR